MAPGSSGWTGALQMRLEITDDRVGLSGNGRLREEELIR
jgi:hypothetical protein